jgi:hypothetical protein
VVVVARTDQIVQIIILVWVVVLVAVVALENLVQPEQAAPAILRLRRQVKEIMVAMLDM